MKTPAAKQPAAALQGEKTRFLGKGPMTPEDVPERETSVQGNEFAGALPSIPPPPPAPPPLSGRQDERAPFNTFAIVSLTLAFSGIFTMGLTGIPGLICGIIAMNQCIDREERGAGMALIATALNVLAIGFVLFMILVISQLG